MPVTWAGQHSGGWDTTANASDLSLPFSGALCLLKQNIQNLAFSCWLGRHSKHKLGRGRQQPTKIPYWWNLRVSRGFSSCTHGSRAEFAGKVPKPPSNASLPHKVFTYQPTHWPFWDFTCPLLTHCRGLWFPPEPSLWVLLTLAAPPSGATVQEIFSLCCLEAAISDAITKLTFHDGIHRNIMKTDEHSEGQAGQVLPGLSAPPPRLAQKKKKKMMKRER